MKAIDLDMTPDAHVLKSMLSTNIDAPEAISELIDNSLDAGAKHVMIAKEGNNLSVSDNGRGCDDLRVMLSLGVRKSHNTTKLGRYGVGMKNAVCGMGESVRISTVHNGILRAAEVNWCDVARMGWKSHTGTEEEAADGEVGTVVAVFGLTKTILIKALELNLPFTFAPAIWGGATISVNNVPLAAWKPKFDSDIIQCEEANDDLDVSFSVIAGMSSENNRGPFVLAYEHRIIEETTEPCMELTASKNMLALVRLSGDWPLLKHKDGIIASSQEARWLHGRLNDICSPLLARCHTDSESVELEGISAELEDAINEARGLAKRPDKHGEKSDSDGESPNRKVKSARIVSGEGDVSGAMKQARRTGFRIVYGALPDESIGSVDQNSTRVIVTLNTKHEHIKQCRETKNLVALKNSAVFLYCNHSELVSAKCPKAQKKMPFDSDIASNNFIALATRIFKGIAMKAESSER